MDKIIAATFDIADQKCITYNALEWHNFIADTRHMLQQGCLVENAAAEYPLDELFDEAYGDEFWFEILADNKLAYSVAFDLISEEFIVCSDDNECEFVMEMAWASDRQEEIFWAE